jgi:L-threonylcarbamoyladenylate synthase
LELIEGWQTQHLFADTPGTIARIAEYITTGHIVGLPTDTVYGVGCAAFNEAAIRRLYRVKQRPLHRAIPLLIADFTDLLKVTSSLPTMAGPYITKYWPGPLTIVLPKHPELPDILSTDDTVAVRVPNHTVARTVIRMAGGAMAVTSANLSGQPPAETAEQVLVYLNGLITAVLDAGSTPMGQASTVIDCTGSEPKIIREGPIKI